MSTLDLDPEEMRRLGRLVVDALVDNRVTRDTPALLRATPAEMAARLAGGPAPRGGRDFADLVDQLVRDVFPYMGRLAHPAYFAFIPGSPTWPSALGDLIAAATNMDVGAWMGSAGPSRVELVVLDWFKDWIGYPVEAQGILVSGGSAANMTALACAREAIVGPMDPSLVGYVADQSHSSIARSARLLGFRPDQLRVLPTDSSLRLRVDALRGAIDADLAQGLTPMFVGANAGATSTGAIDPLPELAEVCRERGLWLHVDAAYGGFAALTRRGREALTGLELADSVTLDPHKWFYQPIEAGCLLVREGRLLREAFEILPDYLRDTAVGETEVNFSDRGLQLTRTSHAVKIWLSVSYFGADAFTAAIDTCLDLALLAEQRVRDTPELELMSPAGLGIVCFRRRFEGVEQEEELARLNAALVLGFEQSGLGLVSSTRLHGRYAIRLCVMNFTSTENDVLGALDWFARTEIPDGGIEVPPSGTSGVVARDLPWLTGGPFTESELRQVPLFARLDAAALGRAADAARELRVTPGEKVVHRWHGSRDFFVILSGTAEVVVGEQVVDSMGPGAFFGEIAALDWGAGFGYTRLATVSAVTPLRLLVLGSSALEELVRCDAEVAATIAQVRRERLLRRASDGVGPERSPQLPSSRP